MKRYIRSSTSNKESYVTRYQMEYYVDGIEDKCVDYVYAEDVDSARAELLAKTKSKDITIIAIIPERVPSKYKQYDKQTVSASSNFKDFKIGKNGVLEQYLGEGGDVVIPEGVTSIGNYALRYHDEITSITIPNSVTSIGYDAFYRCTGLRSITIPDSVKYIGDYAFSGCIRLTSITIPDGVTSIGVCAFDECKSLTSIVIPDSVKYIGDYAFYNCKSLTSITIPDGVTNIGDWAFDGCPGWSEDMAD